jgi:serine protease
MRTFANDETLFITPELALKYDTLMTIKGLRQNQEIAEASPNYLFHALRVPNDTYYGYQWNYPLMNLPQAWDMTTGDPNVIVAVIDTGVLLNHPDLQGKLVAGYDFIADRNIALDGDGIDANPNDPGDQNQGNPGSSSFHGTHVAGTIGAVTNNGSGVAGVGWQTKVMPLRVLGKGGAGTDYDIEQAVRFAAGLANDSRTTPAHRADVVNLSLGGASISSGFQRAVAEARATGVIIVAAAGNDGTNTPMFPASLDGVVSVSAVDINKDRASYSNYGDAIDVAAPGGDNTPDVNGDGVPDGIVSTVGSEVVNNGKVTTIEYAFATSVGTSMASPHIAGVVALMKAANPRLMPQDFDSLLSSGKITEDLGSRGRDNSFGYGLINAQKAVSTAVELSSGVVLQPSAELVVSPKSLNFGVTGTIAILTASNGGRGSLLVQMIQDSSGLLTIREKFIDNNHLGDYTVTVNRAGLNPGTYTTAITVTSNVNTVKIPVILQVGNTNTKGDAGHHYILLVDAKTLDTLLEVRTAGSSGIYDFTFNNLNVGSYKIFAGTDFNNDRFICDSGEACGAFLTLSKPSSIDITQQSREGVEFNTGFNINFLNQQMLADEVPIPSQGIARLQPTRSIAP